ncbi:GOLT1B [Bugula neritina]|uniref:GOLT1B n=1 Tax=Bugula neritina TaxID=10212 RepID=A0A7J7JHJ0_BUGNE|nr:GOLT1B [Bugula neritina]
MLPAITDFQKIGVGLAGFGFVFLFLGVVLLFDKGLLAIGNILFLAGLAFLIGLDRTFRFFFQTHKWRGTAFFLGGIFIVLCGWPMIGMIVECYGFFLLFGCIWFHTCGYQLLNENSSAGNLAISSWCFHCGQQIRRWLNE